MYLPTVEPLHTSTLWKRSSLRPHTLTSRSSNSGSNGGAGGAGAGSNVARGMSSSMVARLLAEAATAHSTDIVENDAYTTLDEQEAAYGQDLEAIRTLGWDYLKPPGVTKTMQVMMEEQEDFTDLEVDDEEVIEDHLLQQGTTMGGGEFDLTNTNVVPVRLAPPMPERQMVHGTGQAVSVTEQELRQTQRFVEEARQRRRTQQGALAEPVEDLAAGPDEDANQAQPDEEQEVDLDNEIAEAADYDYGDDEYDEEAYDRGFMAEEEEDYADENELARLQQDQQRRHTENPENPHALQQLLNTNSIIPTSDVIETPSSAEPSRIEDDEDEELLFTYSPNSKPVLEPSPSKSDDSEGDMSF